MYRLAYGFKAAVDFLGNFIRDFDVHSLGRYVADMVNQILNIDTSVEDTWRNLGEILAAKFTLVLDFVTGFLENLDTAALARAASGVMHSIYEALTDSIDNSNWEKIGTNIRVFFENVDWKGLVDDLCNLVTAAFSGFSDFVKGLFGGSSNAVINWKDIGETISSGFVSLDWGSVFELLCGAIGSAFGGLGQFLSGLLGNALESMMDTWMKNTELCGGDVVAGLLLGILNGMANIGKWIYEHIFRPFIDGFNSAFQIHSPSLVMEKSGGFIIQGLLSGLQTGWDTITEWLSNAIASFENSWISFKVFFVNLWHDITVGVKGAINGIIACINGMIAGMVSGVNAVANTLNRIRVEIPGWVPGFGGKIFGFSLPTFSAPQIPYLEKGGVLKKGQVGLLEGSGAEAVVPLERNTEWINKMADAFMARVQAGSYDLTGNAKTIAALETIADRVTYRAPAMAAGHILPYSVSGQVAGGGSLDTVGVLEQLRSLSENSERQLELMREMVMLMDQMQFVADFGDNIRALARKITKEQRREQISAGR